MADVWYLCKLKPLEEYFFGGERTFDFDGEKASSSAKTRYYIKSEKWPNQSTLLGILRYIVLEKNGYLRELEKEDSGGEEAKCRDRLIGENGFALSGKVSNYGVIKEISPIFLMDSAEDRWIRTPLNHQVKKDEKYNGSYVPMEMSEQQILTEKGKISLPTSFVAKDGLTESVMNIEKDRNHIIKNVESFQDIKGVIKPIEKTGIAKNESEDAFFKKVYWHMDESFCFAFYFKADDDVHMDKLFKADEGKKDSLSGVVFLGQGKSAFNYSFVKTEQDDPLKEMQETINNIGFGNSDVWYALSDVYIEESESEPEGGYSIVKKKYFRSLSDVKQNGDGKKKWSFRTSRRKSKLYELYEAGSVFFYNPIVTDSNDENQKSQKGYRQVGLNHIIKIGGKNNEM